MIGEGGFSQVYKAQHLLIQRQQAVKVLLERHFRRPEFRDRFLREARTVASLDHPNIIHLDDFWVEASQAYLVMPYMSRGTLQGILKKQQGSLERVQIISYLEYICAALDYAHKQGIVHLDLKPLNLLVHDNGKLLLSDFGLAHLMKDGAIAGGSSLRLGTPHYMAPEHIKGFPERRSDLFSLAVILYQMLLGRLPFDDLPHEAILLKNMTEWPSAPRMIRPELPQAVEDVLGKALAKQPQQRYQSANELLIAFKKAFAKEPSQHFPLNLLFRFPTSMRESTHRGEYGLIDWVWGNHYLLVVTENTMQIIDVLTRKSIFSTNHDLFGDAYGFDTEAQWVRENCVKNFSEGAIALKDRNLINKSNGKTIVNFPYDTWFEDKAKVKDILELKTFVQSPEGRKVHSALLSITESDRYIYYCPPKWQYAAVARLNKQKMFYQIEVYQVR